MKNIRIYLAFSFGIAWLLCLVIWLSGGIAGTRALLLSGCMLAPAIAVILTKLITKEGWRGFPLRPRLRGNIRWYLLAWFGPSLLILAGVAFYFLLHPAQFDIEMSGMLAAAQVQLAEQGIEANPTMLQASMLGQMLGGILLAPLLNIIFCAGEEMGWRGYLLPQLLTKYSPKKSLLLSGLIWGLWHAPMIAMGHNYGLGYPGWPWAGIGAMIVFCFVIGCFFSWLSQKVNSFWPAALAHGALNGLAATGTMFLAANVQASPFVGPNPTGIIGGAGLIVAGMICFFALKKPAPLPEPPVISDKGEVTAEQFFAEK